MSLVGELTKALIADDKQQYERLRQYIIASYGYDTFREIQKEARQYIIASYGYDTFREIQKEAFIFLGRR